MRQEGLDSTEGLHVCGFGQNMNKNTHFCSKMGVGLVGKSDQRRLWGRPGPPATQARPFGLATGILQTRQEELGSTEGVHACGFGHNMHKKLTVAPKWGLAW